MRVLGYCKRLERIRKCGERLRGLATGRTAKVFHVNITFC